MLKLGLIPSVDPGLMIKEAQPFINALSAAVGQEVEATVPPDYDAVGQGLANGSIDIGFVGPAGYVVAKDKLNASIDPISRGVLDIGNSSWGRAIIVCHADSGIKEVRGLKGKSFAFSDPISTSGYYFPYQVLAERGVNPETDLRAVSMTGSLGASLQHVADGTVDAAGIGDEILALSIQRGELEDGEIKTIYEGDPIPGSLFVVRNTLDGELLAGIKNTILAMKNMPFCKIGLISSMDPASDQEYDVVRDQLSKFENCHAELTK